MESLSFGTTMRAILQLAIFPVIRIIDMGAKD
jgi:hypothetical protein